VAKNYSKKSTLRINNPAAINGPFAQDFFTHVVDGTWATSRSDV